ACTVSKGRVVCPWRLAHVSVGDPVNIFLGRHIQQPAKLRLYTLARPFIYMPKLIREMFRQRWRYAFRHIMRLHDTLGDDVKNVRLAHVPPPYNASSRFAKISSTSTPADLSSR